MARTPNIDLREDYQRNYLINGAMDFSQRGTSFAAIANNTYFVDRFIYSKVGAMVHTASHDTDVPTIAESGFAFQRSLRVNLTTPDTSIAASDRCDIQQRIEGYNWAQLAGKVFTLSFWVKATLPGTYCVGFRNGGTDRTFVAEYTIDVANTWEKKSITVAPSPSAGTWNYLNGTGLIVNWVLAAGTNFHTTAGSWQTGSGFATLNQINGVNTGANDFRIVGAMITEGAEALPFRRAGRNIGDELALCQRYYEKSYDLDTSIGTGATRPNPAPFIDGNRVFQAQVDFKARKRDTGTITTWDTTGNINRVSGRIAGTTQANITYSIPTNNDYGFSLATASGSLSGGFPNSNGTTIVLYFEWELDAEL